MPARFENLDSTVLIVPIHSQINVFIAPDLFDKGEKGNIIDPCAEYVKISSEDNVDLCCIEGNCSTPDFPQH